MSKSFEFVVFSDLHAHNFPYAATRRAIPGLPGLYNSRLADTAAVLDEILAYCKANEITTAVFCGDLFHRRTSVPTDVRHVVVDRLHLFVDEGITLHMIPGNHDMGDRHGYVHSMVGLGELSDYIHVYDRVFNVAVDGADFIFVPYRESLSAAKAAMQMAGELADMSAQPSILFAHQGIKGALVGSDYVLINDSDLTVPDIPGDKFAACFFGHFHQHQKLFANGWYVGATHQHNWGDAYGNRGYLHVTVKDDKVDFEQIRTMAPEFVVTRNGKTSRGEPSIMKANDFVRAFVGPMILDKDELKEKWNVAHLELVYDVEAEDEEEFVLDSSQLSPVAVLDEWVDKKAPEDLDKGLLLAMGKDILKEVGYD